MVGNTGYVHLFEDRTFTRAAGIMDTKSRRSPSGKVRAECRLHIELELSFGDTCIFSGTDVAPDSVDLFLADSTCNCQIQTCEDSPEPSVYQVTHSIGDSCACTVFCEHACVPTIEDVADGRFVISTYVPDRTVLTDLIAGLKAVSESVRLLRIVEETGGEDGSRSVSFDLTALTHIQRETLEVAVTNGYYDDDTEFSLDDLSAELGVSKSALSRRLSRAEATLVSELVKPE